MGRRYWDVEPPVESARGELTLDLPDLRLALLTDKGVFASTKVDRGTRVLLRTAPPPSPRTGVVDLGAGYGPIAITLARRAPQAGVWAVDVNRRALALVRDNAARAAATNVVAAEPRQVPPALRFDGLYSNPPIRIGKDRLHALLVDWLARLAAGASAWLVVKQAMGADSLHRWLVEQGYATSRAVAKQGYRLLRVDAPAPAGASRPALAREDLEAITADTGAGWTVLGRLAGGYADSVHLVARHVDEVRSWAALKVKQGTWWVEQLDRLVPLVDRLRQLGYPAPGIVAAGRLPNQRAYLLTAFAPGASPSRLARSHVDALLAAIDLHAQVHPPPVRDWSAMVTLFLNGGISEVSFHPSSRQLVERALALLPKPIPALPTGEFVHGDIGPGNVLFQGDRLSAILDLEGFGQGTRVIDMVALLPSAVDPAVGHPELADAIVERAVGVAGERVFRACLAHRVLAILAWSSVHPELLGTASQRAERLLRLPE